MPFFRIFKFKVYFIECLRALQILLFMNYIYVFAFSIFLLNVLFNGYPESERDLDFVEHGLLPKMDQSVTKVVFIAQK